MINKFFYSSIFLFLILGGCASSRYLPSREDVGISQFGSFIKVKTISGEVVRGELIAIDSAQLIVLVDGETEVLEATDQVVIHASDEDLYEKKAVVLLLSTVDHFKLKYAKAPNYAASIPLTLLSCISHGYVSIFTAPVNLLVTITVTATGKRLCQYNDKNMSFEKLKMFARFPQGVPPGVDIETLK